MKEYLRSSAGLIKHYGASFPAFKNHSSVDGGLPDTTFKDLNPEDMDALLDFSFERYFQSSGLFGTPEHCASMVRRLAGIGVNDVACLIDFGLPAAVIKKHLPFLNSVREDLNGATSQSETDTIASLIEKHHVSHLQCTPSMASILVTDDTNHAALDSLQCLLVGGENLPDDLATNLCELVGGEVLNMYGPTEATIWSTTSIVKAGQPVSIGEPIVNTSLYILDKRLNQLPPGTPGELCIGGYGLARGYHQQDTLNNEKYVTHPFSADPTERLYRTGDLVCLVDETLRYMGRMDDQFKMHGFRIEPEEIQCALRKHPNVIDAVVLLREDIPNDFRLVGYVTCKNGNDFDEDEFRAQLSDQLPAHLVPARILPLPSMPLTPNGKTDRKSFPSLFHDLSLTSIAENVGIPDKKSTSNELLIANCWRQVLGTTQANYQANFFDSGGNSLLAVKMLSILRERLSTTLQMTDIFRFPTIQSLARHLQVPSNDVPVIAARRAKARRTHVNRRKMNS